MLTALVSISAIFTGCTPAFHEEVTASDLDYSQLELKMQHAMDPEGRFNRAKTYCMRQLVTTQQSWMEPDLIQMVEVKFRRPDQFKLTTYTDNEPESAIIINGKQGWAVNYRTEKVNPIKEAMMPRLNAMMQLTNPANRLRNVFQNISVDRSRIDDEDFYRLTCSNPGRNPIYIYAGCNDFLTRRMRMNLSFNTGSTLDYDSQMLRYSMYEGIRIPDESVVRQGGTKQHSKVIYYKLDTEIDDSEFRPPLF